MPDMHGFRTIADIMRAFNPFEGAMYKESLQMGRMTREMCCLMEGRHVHPSTLYPGGIGTVATPQVFSDYLVRLLKVLDFVKKAVPLNDDLFDFFYESPARLREGRPPAHPARLLGHLPGPRGRATTATPP